VYPSGIAGLAMGFSQWSIIRRMHKYTYLWIPVTTIGSIASIGAALTFVVALPAYSEGLFFHKIGGMLVIFTLIAPIALLIGPIFQWLIIRCIGGNLSSKELSKICVGWIVAAFLPFVMFYLIHLRNPWIMLIHPWYRYFISLFLYVIVLNIPSGVVFAYITRFAIHPIKSNTNASLHV